MPNAVVLATVESIESEALELTPRGKLPLLTQV
jgi:hypothetical protein